MKVVLIGPGFKELPCNGWGAVERIVWDYYELLKNKGHDVHIVNTSKTNDIITHTNSLLADVVHIMYDDYIVVADKLNAKKILYTSHYAYLTNNELSTRFLGYYNNILKHVIRLQNCVTIAALSTEIKNIYVNNGFSANKIIVVPNGARDDIYNYTSTPLYPNKSIYLAKIEKRKAQYKYQTIPNIDFVGNYERDGNAFDVHSPNYLGEWDRETLYKNMTNYANLILLSDGEADPLVVKEALMAGLGVVISECSAANLDQTKQFISIIPNSKLNDIEYIKKEIDKNRIFSVLHRDKIKQYGNENFSLIRIVDKYCELFLNQM